MKGARYVADTIEKLACEQEALNPVFGDFQTKKYPVASCGVSRKARSTRGRRDAYPTRLDHLLLENLLGKVESAHVQVRSQLSCSNTL